MATPLRPGESEQAQGNTSVLMNVKHVKDYCCYKHQWHLETNSGNILSRSFGIPFTICPDDKTIVILELYQMEKIVDFVLVV